MLNRKRARTGEVIKIIAHQEIDIEIELKLAGSSAECSSDECSSDEEVVDMSLSDSDSDISSDESFSDSDFDPADSLYSDTMTMGELSAGHDRLERFLEKSSKSQPVSFVELYRIFDDSAKFIDFISRAKRGTAELTSSDMASEAFNHSTPRLKKKFLEEIFGDKIGKAGLLMLFVNGKAMRDIMDIRYHIVQKIHAIGDVIEAKNKERYEAVAAMPAYSTVIAKRRAEVEAMLDAGDQKQYLATQQI